MGLGGGTFRAPATYDIGYSPARPLIVDVNGDGRLDLVVAADGFVSVFRNPGSGVFGMPTTYSGAAGAVLAVDLDGDGRPDLVSTSSDSGVHDGVQVLWNQGATFTAPTYLEGRLTALAVADMDGDGRPDLVAGMESLLPDDPMSAAQDGLHVLINQGNSFAAPVTYFKGSACPR